MTEGLDPSRLLLATDFDGTLAEVVADPDQAAILPDAHEALRRLVPRLLRVAVISGRGADDLRRRLPLPGVRLLGDYGLESPSALELEAIRSFDEAAAALVRGRPGIHLEAKSASTSVHFREAPEAGPGLLAELRPLAQRLDLQLRAGRLVAEVMPRSANKETALAGLIEELQPGAVIWCGDDSGDLGCFELVRRLRVPHLGVGVSWAGAPRGLFDACDLVVNGPRPNAELLSELAGWASLAAPDRVGHGSGG